MVIDSAHHVIGRLLTQETRVPNAVDHVASAIHQSLPSGDVLETIQRRNFTVATQSGGFLYLVKASASEAGAYTRPLLNRPCSVNRQGEMPAESCG